MTVDVWVFYAKQSRLQPTARNELEDHVRKRGWEFQERPVETLRVDGRPVRAVEARDATAVYRRAHRAAVGALIIDDLVVNCDPSRSPAPGITLGLPKFLQNKCLTKRVRSDEQSAVLLGFLDELALWAGTAACDGENDPRVLPLHVFDPRVDGRELATAEGRRRFGDAHGHANRRDPKGRVWQRATALHGRDVLTVAGRSLVAGFHWDVQNATPTPTRVASTDAVWELGAGSYLNAHPDAHLASTHSKARQVWPSRRR